MNNPMSIQSADDLMRELSEFRETPADMPEPSAIAYDTETHKVQPGLFTPPHMPNGTPAPASESDIDAALAKLGTITAGDEHDDANPLDHVEDQLAAAAPVDSTETIITPHVTAEYINATLRNVRKPFEAKMKRGKEHKGARTRLAKKADAAVEEFRASYLSELTEQQALSISLGITGLVGDSITGFRYLDGDKVSEL